MNKFTSLLYSLLLLLIAAATQSCVNNQTHELTTHKYLEALETEANPHGLCIKSCLNVDAFNQEIRNVLHDAEYLDGLEMVLYITLKPEQEVIPDSNIFIRGVIPPTGQAMPDSTMIARHYSYVKSITNTSLFTPYYYDQSAINTYFNVVLKFTSASLPEKSNVELLSANSEPYLNLAELAQSVTYPRDCQVAGVEGTVIIRALMDSNGKFVKYRYRWDDSFLAHAKSYSKAATEKYLTMFFEAAEDALDDVDSGLPSVDDCDAIQCWVSIPVKFQLR